MPMHRKFKPVDDPVFKARFRESACSILEARTSEGLQAVRAQAAHDEIRHLERRIEILMMRAQELQGILDRLIATAGAPRSDG